LPRPIPTVALVLTVLSLGTVSALAAPPIPADWPYRANGRPVSGRHGMVSCVSPVASRVGVEILKQGGNAVDAAVAVAFALAVTWPEAGNLGGGGFMVVRDARHRSYALDYRETAPHRASHDMFVGPNGATTDWSLTTRLGVGTPGTVQGLWVAHEKLGHLPWKTLVSPAMQLAKDGFVVDGPLAESFRKYRADLQRDPEAARLFLPKGEPPKAGQKLIQADLARTLAAIRDRGPAGFYRGPVARAIASDMAAHGGLVDEQDLRTYRAVWRKPLSFRYHGREIVSMPPPSSGGVLLGQMLEMLEHDDLKTLGYHTAPMIHLVAEVERRAFADRNAYLGDPDFVANPLPALLDPAYAQQRRATIDPERATPAYSTRPGLAEHPETTHFVVVDREGNAVSNTYTLNGAYGTGIVAPGTGVLLNNEMDDFATRPGQPNLFGLVQGERNAVAPGKRMLSSMSPSILLDPKGRFAMAVGSPGGSTIPTTTLQVILNVLDYGMNVREAVCAPRFHHQGLPQTVFVEPKGFSSNVLQRLKDMGHPLEERPLGDAQAILRKPDGTLEGWADPRKGGVAIAY